MSKCSDGRPIHDGPAMEMEARDQGIPVSVLLDWHRRGRYSNEYCSPNRDDRDYLAQGRSDQPTSQAKPHDH